jgi:hypothetical protein
MNEFVADVGGSAGDEGEAGHISGEPDTAGDDDVGLRAIRTQPFTTAVGERVKPRLILIGTR